MSKDSEITLVCRNGTISLDKEKLANRIEVVNKEGLTASFIGGYFNGQGTEYVAALSGIRGFISGSNPGEPFVIGQTPQQIGMLKEGALEGTLFYKQNSPTPSKIKGNACKYCLDFEMTGEDSNLFYRCVPLHVIRVNFFLQTERTPYKLEYEGAYTTCILSAKEKKVRNLKTKLNKFLPFFNPFTEAVKEAEMFRWFSLVGNSEEATENISNQTEDLTKKIAEDFKKKYM